MVRKSTWSSQPSRILRYHPADIIFSMVLIAGFAIIHSYCQYLFLGPCDTQGSNFPLGATLMVAGALGLVAYRLRLLRGNVFANILVFTEGTIIREVNDNGGGMVGGKMLGNSAGKLSTWKRQGAEILYLTSRKRPDEVAAVRKTLKENDFPKGHLYYRHEGDEYKDIAEKIMPDVIVEDDCASIGGEREMTYAYIAEDLKPRIKSVVVREFEGIDSLPDNLLTLLQNPATSKVAR